MGEFVELKLFCDGVTQGLTLDDRLTEERDVMTDDDGGDDNDDDDDDDDEEEEEEKKNH
jgi:hypothetical protein